MIVPANVVANFGSEIPEVVLVLFAGCADEHEAALIVVAVIVLKERMTGIEI